MQKSQNVRFPDLNTENKSSFTSSINWPTLIFISIYHLTLLTYVPYYFYTHSFSLSWFALALVIVGFCNICITAGYHRLWSHKAWTCHPIVETLLLAGCTLAMQSSAISWSSDHRWHHSKTDTDQDPYSIKKGFLYAHLTWMFEKRPDYDEAAVRDLLQKSILRFQHRFYLPLMILSQLSVFLFFAYLSQNYTASFVYTFLIRLFLSQHSTWFVNSLAHTWGSRTYCKELTAVDNFFVAILTFGEGYHNYHHAFPRDYRNGIRWFHYDPTKWLIWSLSKLGLANNLKSVDDIKIRSSLIQEDMKLLYDKISCASLIKEEKLKQQIHEMSIALHESLKKWQELLHEKRSTVNKHRKKLIKTLIKEHKRYDEHLWKHWLSMQKQIDKLTLASQRLA